MTVAVVVATLSLVLCVISFLYLRWYINRKTSADMFLADYRAEVGKLVAEIDAAADRDALLVEARIKALKKLLEDADRRIAVYVREMERRQAGAATQSNLLRQPASVTQPTPAAQSVTSEQSSANQTLPSPVSPTTPLYTNLGRGGRGGLRIVNVSEPEPTSTVAVSNVADNAEGVGSEKKELRVQIAELAAQGLSPAEIASRLKVSRSEVDTVLSLSRLKKNTA